MASQEVLSALEKLHREIEKLEPAIKHVEIAQQVTQTVKSIPQKHVDLLHELKNEDAQHKEELKTLFVVELSEITDENKRLQKTTSEIQQQVKLEQESLSQLKETIESFQERVQTINFPERLDKLDANISGIMAAIQSIQSRLDSLERNISDRLRDIQEYNKESRSKLTDELTQLFTNVKSDLDLATSKHQTLSYITWFLIVCAIITTLIN
jgi:chromosome segregation ATPase